MNITDIIREEHELCQARIAERVAALLMGGVTGAPAPRALPAAPRAYEPPAQRSHSDYSDTQTPITLTRKSESSAKEAALKGGSRRAVVARQTYEDIETVVSFIMGHPGCFGIEIIEHLGCKNGMDRRYINVTKKMRTDERVMVKGKGSRQAYYFNENAPVGRAQVSRPTPPTPKRNGQGRSGNAAAPVKDAMARDDKLVAYIKSHQGIVPTELRDHFRDKAGMGTGEALNSAIHRLCMKGRITKKPTKKIGRGGQPVMELRAK